MEPRPVILLEFNELSRGLMDRFIKEGKLPSFERLYRESHVFTTESDGDVENLEPWIQWITVHSGIPTKTHKIANLGDGHLLREKSVWDLVSESGKKIWVCGSMNVQYQVPIRGWVLPDPWTTEVKPHPADDLLPFFRFVSANVLDHTRNRTALPFADRLAFVRFMMRHGLSSETVAAIVTQLISELRHPARMHWKRAAILDKLQFDLFRWVYRRERPAFSTFFSNSTAHFQHLYWRNLEPEAFHVKPTPAEQAAYEEAILYGYQQMDDLVRRFLLLAGDAATLVFCTALSQQPCLIYDDKGGKRWYRPRDFARLLREVGIAPSARVSPVMAHQFQIDFDSEPAAIEGESKLQALRYVDGRNALMVNRSRDRILSGCRIIDDVDRDAVLRLGESGRTIPFFDLFYQIAGIKSGMHHPDGMLWIRTPGRQHRVETAKVPLVSVAPTLLEMLGLPKPTYMAAEPIRRGFAR